MNADSRRLRTGTAQAVEKLVFDKLGVGSGMKADPTKAAEPFPHLRLTTARRRDSG